MRLTLTDGRSVDLAIADGGIPAEGDLLLFGVDAGQAWFVGASPAGDGSGTFRVSWQGWTLNVNAPDQVSGGRTFRFQSWSDGGAQAHSIVTPANPTTWTAKFRRGGKG